MIELLRQNIRLVAIIAVVVVLLIVNVMFYLQWRSAEGDLDDVKGDLGRATTNLNITRAQYDLDALQDEEDELSAKPQFPEEFPVVDLMLHVARGADLYVTITEVKPVARVDTEVIGGKAYHAYRTQVTVAGTLPKIISYIKYIEGGAFNSIKIEDVSLSGSGESWQGKFTIAVITQ